ncbi:hypothetical protein KR054_000224, partial [Drosophila jambulina]
NTASVQKPKKMYPEMEDFFRLPVIFYHTIGLDPYDSPSAEERPGILFHIFFAFHMTNLAFVLAMEIIFVVLSFLNKENFVESCMVICYIGFVIGGFLKIFSVLFKKQLMTSLVNTLNTFFPPPQQEVQEQYKVSHYLGRSLRVIKSFSGLYLTLVAVYNLFNVTQYTLKSLRHSTDAEQILPYSPFAPWDYSANWRFYLTYLSQSMAGYTATTAHISADLMIFSVTMQVVMHFDRLATALREFQVRAATGSDGGADEDLKELSSLIAYHNQILGISDVVNEVFGIPLLINFASSSILLCLVSFQMTIGLGQELLAKLVLMLVSCSIEIYLLCSFSQMLIDASESVAFAVYDMNYFEADMRFRKMLILIALRAQKPICLKATVFLDISIETMSGFMRTSYKFFCAIRTMYQ